MKVGVQLHPQNTTMPALRTAWEQVDELGAYSLFTWDHFFPPLYGRPEEAHFEGWQLLAAMAVTTHNVKQIGMLVSGNGYRNPDLLADMARTLDHLSGGRAVLGMGSGWFRRDYDEYGYEFGTAGSRLDALAAALPRIRRRLQSLQPPPIGPLPILIGGGGEKRTLRLVAEHASIWNVASDVETMRRKSAVLDQWCAEIGRNPAEIERTAWVPHVDPTQIAAIRAAGFQHVILGVRAPYDLGPLRQLLDLERDSPE